MKSISILFLLIIIGSCSSSKTSNTALSLEQIQPGKDQSAVIGKIISIVPDGRLQKLTLDVKEAKQGGVNAVAFRAGENDFYLSQVFIENYEKKYSKSISDQVKVDQSIVLFVLFNPMTKRNMVTDVISEN